MTWRLTRLASRRTYNGIKLFSEPRPVDARAPKGIGTVIATSFISLCWFRCYIASAMRWHKCHQQCVLHANSKLAPPLLGLRNRQTCRPAVAERCDVVYCIHWPAQMSGASPERYTWSLYRDSAPAKPVFY